MDNHFGLVQDFKNLNVFKQYDSLCMDLLVQDLNNALDDTHYHNKQVGEPSNLAGKKVPYKKKRTRKRKPPSSNQNGNISEASESSIDEALRDYIENFVCTSDSDEFVLSSKHFPVGLPDGTSLSVSLAESDSVTENFSPIRPLRRRRKGKKMALEPETDLDSNATCQLYDILRKRRSKLKCRTLEVKNDNIMDTYEVNICKTSPSENSPTRSSSIHACKSNKQTLESHSKKVLKSKDTSSSCSSFSSGESDAGGIYTNDEARDGDDEYSDFFHESGSTCSDSITSWRELEKEEENSFKDGTFEKIFAGSFDIMTPNAKRSYKARISKFFPRGEDIRRYKLRKGRRGMYSSISIVKPNPYENITLFSPMHSPPYYTNDNKRRRKTPTTMSINAYNEDQMV